MLTGQINKGFSKKKSKCRIRLIGFYTSIYFTPPNSKKEFEENYKNMKDSTGEKQSKRVGVKGK